LVCLSSTNSKRCQHAGNDQGDLHIDDVPQAVPNCEPETHMVSAMREMRTSRSHILKTAGEVVLVGGQVQ
jgi:hypothetical protein